MKNEKYVEFRIFGRRALFSDPLTRAGGEKMSYPVPTYQALKGILEGIYWKPTFQWYVDKVRIMKRIATEPVGIRLHRYESGQGDLSSYTYLSDVEYQVLAHYEWDESKDEFKGDRNVQKHDACVTRHLSRGGRYDMFLGTRECQAYVEPCEFGSGESYYDNTGDVTYGLMFHGFDYPGDFGPVGKYARFWRPKMSDGIIDFIRPEECTDRKLIEEIASKSGKSKNREGRQCPG